MLEQAKADTPVRTLKQRITTLINSWFVAQDQLYRVHPEFDDYGELLLPCACSPFVAVHEQLEQMRQLVLDSVPALWQNFCSRSEYATTKNNSVPLLMFILNLDQEALQMNVISKRVGSTQLRVQPHRSETFNTSGEPSAQMATIPVSDAKTLEKRAIAGDVLVETNRVSLDQNRTRSVPQTAMRFFLEANISEVEIHRRHENQLCY